MNRDQAEAVLARAIELEGARPAGEPAWSPEAIVRIGAEIGVGADAVAAAMDEVWPSARKGVLDRVVGRAVVTRSASVPMPSGTLHLGIERRMSDLRMTPSTRRQAWMQQRTSWPDPAAELTVATVVTDVRSSDAGTSVRVTAHLEEARAAYAAALAMAVALGMLVAAAAGLPGVAMAVAGIAVATLTVRRRLALRRHRVASNLAGFLEDLRSGRDLGAAVNRPQGHAPRS